MLPWVVGEPGKDNYFVLFCFDWTNYIVYANL